MTRLIWVILFAVVVGLLVVFTLRGLQSGTGAAVRAMELDAARRELEDRYPRAVFDIRLDLPGPGVRNLVVSVGPGPYSTELPTMLDKVVAVVEAEVDLTGLDTLKVLVDGSLALAAPLEGK